MFAFMHCASVPCSVDKSVDRTLIQLGVEDNLLDVPVIVSKTGQRSREELVESVARSRKYILETRIRRGGRGEGRQ